ncbi:hypothetical protein PybrP1_011653 [[Pythium] brassicae (nom. inval.)]|nr:hypothetical protein PybrP1_011653 [[Pythium] brassicae (nom. inval.)]
MDAAAKVRPTPQLSTVSRDDIRNTLHTFFRSQAPPKRHVGRSDASGGPGAVGRKRVYSFVQVQKKKVSLTSKRLLGHAGLGSGASKFYILCVTVQDGAGAGAGLQPPQQQHQLHYLQLLSSLQVEVRQSWDIGRLDVIENNGLTSEKTRGAFALCFAGEDAPWQWLVAASEPKFAMHEFLWSICALAVDKKKVMPRLVRIDAEALSEVAIQLSLQKKYSTDVDLLDHMASTKKANDEADDPASGNNSGDLGDSSAGGKKPAGASLATAAGGVGARLTAAENDDAAALLAGVAWGDAQLASIEEELKHKLRVLEDENITFLLSFEGGESDNNNNNNNNSKVTTGTSSQPASASLASAALSGAAPATSVDKILAAIDAVLARVAQVKCWTDDSDEFLAQTSQDMLHFEALNNQLEMHFKNSVALQEALARMVALVDIPRELMGVLLKPPSLFPDDAPLPTAATTPASSHHSSSSSTASSAEPGDLGARMRLVLATIARVDEAIKSTTRFPASEMSAFRARGDELAKLARGFTDKVCAALDAFLQRRTKQWLWSSRAATAAAASAVAGSGSPGKNAARGSSAFGVRDLRDVSSSMRSVIELSRGGGGGGGSRALTSFESSTEVREMDWAFSNEPFHADMLEYLPLVAHLQSLDARAAAALRQVYAKNLATVYGPHAHALFRCLREKLPWAAKPHFAKPQALQSWSFHLSSSHLGDALGATPLLQQALDHLVPLVVREQRFMSALFFPDARDDTGAGEPEELALAMESVFEKLLKRLLEFGEAAAARNILDALGLVVLVHGELETYRSQSEFLFNVMVSFQLQLKRILIKFTEDQEAWINSHHTDTRMAGVLGPVVKTLTMVSRLEESVCGKSDDSTLASIYNRLLPATIRWLERVSDSKPKYRSLTRLENFLFIRDKLRAVNAAPELPLAQFAAQAHAKYVEHLALYVAYVWEYEFKALAPMFRSIEELRKALPAQEIQFHTPRQDVRRVLDATAATFEKAARAMHERMKKHFAGSSKTLPVAWKRLVAYALERLAAYEKAALECYELRFEPSPERGAELLRRFATAD